ncbi:hypothetical protein ACQSSU_19535 [Micromonospora echinospora]
MVWATGVALPGHLAAASYRQMEREWGSGEWALLTLVGVGVALRVWRHRRRRSPH